MFTKTVKKLILLLLVTVMLFSSTACGKNNGSENNNVVKETSDFFFKDGKSDYSIVIPKDADSLEITASRELKNFVEEATGFALPIITDEGLKHNADNKYISIGDTALASAVNFKVTAKNGKEQSFKIKTFGKSIFLLGASKLGTLYSVYEFLKYELDYEYYFTDVYSLKQNVANLDLKEYDVTEIPDIGQATGYSVGWIDYSVKNRQRLKVTAVKDWLMPINGSYLSVHNVMLMFPLDKFLSEHKDFYTEDKTQLCFTAHGKQEEQQAMLDELIKIVKKSLKDSDGNIFTMSLMDNMGVCPCDSCRALKDKYGADSVGGLLILNKLSDYFKGWFKTEEGKPFERDLKFMLLAYQDIKEAPTSSEFKCNDNVGVYIALDSFHYSYGLDAEANKDLMEIVRSWRKYTNLFMYYRYAVNFNHYFIPYDSFYEMQDFYKEVADNGAFIINEQSQTQNKTTCVAWGNLKAYLATKLRWDVDADVTKLTKGYFDTCYLDASDLMYSVYLQYKAHFALAKQKLIDGELSGVKMNALGSIFGEINNAKIWDAKVVKGWYDTMLTALKKIETKKDSSLKYQKAYEMICAEIVSPLYLMLVVNKDAYSVSQINEFKAQFKAYCDIASVDAFYDSNNGSINNLYDILGIV